MIDTTLQKFIDFLQTVSPLIWQSLIKQVYIEATARLLWAVLFIAIAFIVAKLINIKKQEYNQEYSDGRFIQDSPWVWLWAVVSVSGIIAFGMIVSSIMWFSNPEFYAIRFLLEKISGQY